MLLLPPRFLAGGVAYQDEVLADTPTRYYRLGEASGTVAVDSMANSDGTYSNTPTLGAASLIRGGDPAARFVRASSEYMLAPLLTTPTLPISLECWFIAHSLPSHQAIISTNRTTNNFHGITIGIASTNRLLIRNGNGSSWTKTFTAGSYTMLVDTIYHVVAVVTAYDSAKLYLNGAELATTMTGSATSMSLAGGNVSVAASLFDLGYADMTIDEVAFYNNKALSADRILAHYNAGRLS